MKKMHSSIRSRVPQIQCYKCGNDDILEICHHCGRAMCSAHKQPNIPWWVGGIYSEFKGLGLKRHPASDIGRHCETCLHFSLRWKFWVLAGMIAGIVGVSAFIVGFQLRFTLAVFTFWLCGSILGSMLGLLFVLMRNENKNSRYRPLIPVLGQLMHIKIGETIRGLVTLDKNGTYYSSSRPRVEPGKIEIQLKLNSLDRNHVHKYKQKYTKSIPIPLIFHAGFLVLHGRPNVRIYANGDPINPHPQSHTVVLFGNARKNAFLMGNQVEAAADWLQNFDYTFRQLPPKVGRELPIQIIPRIVRQGTGWSLELLVQVTPGIGTSELLTAKATIKELTLSVTPMWGEPKSTSDTLSYTMADDNNPNSTLAWKNIKIPGETFLGMSRYEKLTEGEESLNKPQHQIGEIDNMQKDEVLGEERGRRKFFVVRFEHGITPEMVSEPLSGHLKVRFDYAFSGIQSLSYFYPTGKKHDLERVRTELYTDVNIDFQLNLNSLCFQEPFSPPMSVLGCNVPPDHLMIRKLSDKLAEDGVYVQRIIENEPRTDKTSAKIINRYWRMEGRKYIGLYPIDFHIVITGRQEYAEVKISDEKTFDKGQTFFEVKIFAMVFNEDMRREVLSFAEQLRVIIEYVLAEPDVEESDLSQKKLTTHDFTSEESSADRQRFLDVSSLRSSSDDQQGAVYGR